jgi:hypothetical protein
MDLKKEIFLSDGKRPLWQIVIGSLFFAFGICCILYVLYIFYILGFNAESINGCLLLIILAIFASVGGFSFSLTKSISINLEKETLKSRYSVGLVGLNYYSKIPTLEYVSVFKNPQEVFFEVKLWYKGNKHYTIAYFDNTIDAINFGIMFSDKLSLNLLDATERGNFKWIDKTEL